MSFSSRECIGRAVGLNPDGDELTLLADAGWFDDQSIGDASGIISRLAPVQGARLYQFSAVDDARVILAMGFSFVVSQQPSGPPFEGEDPLLRHIRIRGRSPANSHQALSDRTQRSTYLLGAETCQLFGPSLQTYPDLQNRPGMCSDSVPRKVWSHVREYAEEVPGRAA